MKAVLVIDTPKDCGDCPCLHDELWMCQADTEYHRGAEYSGRPSWCPLRPLPEKKPISYHDDLYGDVEKNYTNIGWNLCLEELEK